MPFLSENGVKSGEDVLHQIRLSVQADHHIQKGIDVALRVFFEEISLASFVLFVEGLEVFNGLGLEG